MCRRLGGIGRENAIAHKTQYSLILSTSCGKNIKGKKTKKVESMREKQIVLVIVESGKQRGIGGGVERRMRPSHAKGRIPTDVSIWKERDW